MLILASPTMPMAIIEITTTTETAEQAEQLATLLLERRLAACVQIIPGIRSHYRWKGKVCIASELRLSIKTLATLERSILALFTEHHPYELPEFLVTPVHGSPKYAEWLAEQVAD